MAQADTGPSGDDAVDDVHVLVVDDDAEYASLTASYLERDATVAVSMEHSATAALETLATGSLPECVVSDHDMPGMNGLEFLAAVREAHPGLPFILHTGKGSEEIASEAVTAGVTDYVRKGGPEQFDVLANRIQNAVDRRRSEAALRQEKELLEQVLATTPGSIVCARTGEITFATKRAAQTLGVEQSDLVGARWDQPEVWKPEVDDGAPSESYESILEPVFENGTRRHDECVSVTGGDGTRRHLELDAAPLRSADGSIDRVVVSVRDRSEETVRRRELERTRAVLDAVGDATYVLDEDGHFTYANDALAELTGYAVDELVGAHCSLVLPPAAVDAGTELISDLLTRADQRGTIQMELVSRSGDRVPVENHVALLPRSPEGFQGTAGIARDITVRKERERRLRESEQKTASVVREASDGVVIAQDGEIKFVNPRACEILHGDVGALVGLPIADVVAPDDREKVGDRLRRRLAGEAPERRYEFDALTLDGDAVPIEFTASTITYEGAPAVLAICRDVSERNQRERELEQYETVVETAPDTVFIVDEHANYVGGNNPAGRVAGYTHDELLEKSIPELVEEGRFGPEVIPRYTETVRHLLSSRNDDERGTFEFTIQVEDETRFYECHVSLRPFDRDAGESFRGSIGILRDVTDRNRRERELERQNERLEGFANVLSHDLRNPLNVATGNLQLAKESGDDRAFDRVATAHDRMNEIIDDLLTLARTGDAVDSTEPVSLHALADAAWATVETGDATLELGPDCRFDADPGRVQQLLENLFANAVTHAGPAVSVTVEPLADDSGFAVEDDGPGIPPDIADTVFDPGVSTRSDGTGFGLAIVADIADAHGWSVHVAGPSAEAVDGDDADCEDADTGARIETRWRHEAGP